MKTAIIVHGAPNREEVYDPREPSASNHHWLPWLQKQLIVRDYAAHTPEIPNAWNPDYPTWKQEFERFDLSEQTLLVGHSCGGGFLVRWLSEQSAVRVDRVVLVAPWLDPSRDRTSSFFDFRIDPLISARTAGLTIFNSDNDSKSIQASVTILRETLQDVDYREFHEYGHFCLDDMGSVEFPELLEALVGSTGGGMD